MPFLCLSCLSLLLTASLLFCACCVAFPFFSLLLCFSWFSVLVLPFLAFHRFLVNPLSFLAFVAFCPFLLGCFSCGFSWLFFPFHLFQKSISDAWVLVERNKASIVVDGRWAWTGTVDGQGGARYGRWMEGKGRKTEARGCGRGWGGRRMAVVPVVPGHIHQLRLAGGTKTYTQNRDPAANNAFWGAGTTTKAMNCRAPVLNIVFSASNVASNFKKEND